jgi:hypothetical protein
MTRYSTTKIGVILFLSIGISLGLYFGLDDNSDMSYSLSLYPLSLYQETLESNKSIYDFNRKSSWSQYTNWGAEGFQQLDGTAIVGGSCLSPKNVGYGICQLVCNQCVLSPEASAIIKKEASCTRNCGQDGVGKHYIKNAMYFSIDDERMKELKIINDEGKYTPHIPLSCDIKSNITTYSLDGKSNTISGDTVNYFQALDIGSSKKLKIGDDEVYKVRVTPTISCDKLPSETDVEIRDFGTVGGTITNVRSSDLTFTLKSDRIISPIISENAKIEGFKLTQNEKFDLITFEIKSDTILEAMDSGEYSTELYFNVYGNVLLETPYLESLIDFQIPKDSMKKTVNSDISKTSRELAPVIKQVEKVEVIQPEPVEDDDFYIETSFIDNYERYTVSPTVSLAGVNEVDGTTSPTEAISEFSEVVTSGEYDRLNDQRFTTIYLMAFLFVLIALLIRKQTRKVILTK